MSAPPSVCWVAPGRAPSAVPALVAGITGAFVPVIVPAALACWLATTAHREINDSDGQLGGRGMVVVSFVLAVYSLLATAGLVASFVSES